MAIDTKRALKMSLAIVNELFSDLCWFDYYDTIKLVILWEMKMFNKSNINSIEKILQQKVSLKNPVYIENSQVPIVS